MEDSLGLSLLPYSIPGTDPGSVYRVVARTADHIVAVRRLAEHAFRIRFARIDGKPLNLKNTTPTDWEARYHFKIGKDWTYMSMPAFGFPAAGDIIARLVHIALVNDETLSHIPNENTEEGVAMEKAMLTVVKEIATKTVPQAVDADVEVTSTDKKNYN